MECLRPEELLVRVEVIDLPAPGTVADDGSDVEWHAAR
jgi:hypothetical protein